MNPISGQCIWANPKPYNLDTQNPHPDKTRLELTDIVRFRGKWYCTFHEGPVHGSHPDGKAWLISSADGGTWEEVRTFKWEGGDIWDSRLSVTAEGNLMLHAAIWFVSREARNNGHFYQLENERIAPNDQESQVALQTATWLSSDGIKWSSAYSCPTGINSLRWGIVWHNGMGYGMAYYGKDIKGVLYRTRDGKSWRVLKDEVFSDAQAGENEAELVFLPHDTLCCLARCGSPRLMMGIARGPYYQEWDWKSPGIDWEGDGTLRSAADIFNADFGGPKLIRLRDNRIVVAGRVRGPERPDGTWRKDPTDPEGKEDGRIMLFWLDPHKGVLTRFLEIDGTSYPGIVEHDGVLWVTYVVYWGDEPGVYLAKVKIPNV